MCCGDLRYVVGGSLRQHKRSHHRRVLSGGRLCDKVMGACNAQYPLLQPPGTFSDKVFPDDTARCISSKIAENAEKPCLLMVMCTVLGTRYNTYVLCR